MHLVVNCLTEFQITNGPGWRKGKGLHIDSKKLLLVHPVSRVAF